MTNSFKKKLWFSIFLSLFGLSLSVYATLHFIEVTALGKTNAVCNINSIFNCDGAALSKYGKLFDLPLGLFGGIFFLVYLTVLGGLFFSKWGDLLKMPAFVLSVVGALVSTLLGIISTTQLYLVCVVCLGIYVVCFGLLFSNIKMGTYKNFEVKKFFRGSLAILGVAGIIALGAVQGFYFLRKHMSEKIFAETFSKKRSLNESLQAVLPEATFSRELMDRSWMPQNYAFGNKAAKVVLLEFVDFRCPYCSNFAPIVKQIVEHFGDKIYFVIKNFPMDQSCNFSLERTIHYDACQLAKLGYCMGKYNKFKKFYENAYSGENPEPSDDYVEFAKVYDVPADQLKSCVLSKEADNYISNDVAVGNRQRITATPSLFINGKSYSGNLNFVVLKRVIEALLKVE